MSTDTESPLPANAGWHFLGGVIGLMVGIGGAVIYFGGSLRQIDINTARLGIIEQQGTPQLQAIRLQLEDTRARISSMQGRVDQLPIIDSETRAALQALKVQVDTNTHQIELLSTANLTLLQRLATIEADAKANSLIVGRHERDIEMLRGDGFSHKKD